MGGRREVSIISDRPVTSGDLKEERSSFRGSVSTLLLLVLVYFFSEQNIVLFVKIFPQNWFGTPK